MGLLGRLVIGIVGNVWWWMKKNCLVVCWVVFVWLCVKMCECLLV